MTAESRPLTAYAPSGFFAFRTPLLPFETLVAWGEGLGAVGATPATLEQTLAQDRAVLRERLRRLISDPVVREALFVASPVLEESLPVWEAEPESERGQKVERTLVRYLARMAGRATPFGLFAGHSVGRFAGHTRLRIVERSAIRRHTRLDMDYLCALVEQVRRQPEVRAALRYVPNSSLYRAADRWRYLEMRVRGRERSYHLVGVEPSPYLEATLERARSGGARVEELAAALVVGDPEVSLEEAREYVETLVTEQLLVPTWAPCLTGPEPVPHLLESARSIPALSEVRQRLSASYEALARLDAAPPGHTPEPYKAVARSLEALPTPVELPRLFQVDMFRPAPEATLSSGVVEELLGAIRVLQTLGDHRTNESMAHFRTRFLERYEQRAVPLVEALDEECGIGFSRSQAPGSGTGPLLAGFVFPPNRPSSEKESKGARFAYLLRRLESVWRSGARELVLTPEDVEAMRAAEPSRLPESFGVLATVVARSSEAVDQGDFQLSLQSVHGPSGAVMLGRFCHGDAELEGCVREHLRAEEALRPDALFAEVVHLPQERLGNITCRPLLRRHDIVFLGESGAAESERIPLTDLWVSVEGERVVLRSRRLGREVIPRMSNAHNYGRSGLGLYRFLCLLQNQHDKGLHFDWGPLANATSLPRVRYGRTILTLAQWRLEARTIQEWGKARGAERFAAVQLFRAQVGMPRWVCLCDGDNRLPVDLDNALSVETFVQLLKGRTFASLEEFFPGAGELCMESNEGHYVHELVVPFVLQEPVAPPSRPLPAVALRSSTPRHFPPGSEWLYLKLYGGAATLDRLLATTLGDTVRRVVGSGVADRWFFLRYKDPDEHLRLRFHGTPSRLEAEVWPAVRAACASILEEGTGWRVQLDTYEREVERYGGPAGIELAEELFTADSEAVLDILQAHPGDEGAEVRWRLALLGLDALLEDLGLPLERKLAVVERLRASFGTEFRVDKGFEAQLGLRYRRESRSLQELLTTQAWEQGPMRAGGRSLRRRGERLRPTVERLRQAEREGRLTSSVEQLAGSYLHMHVNRMLPLEQRAQELILYDFLARLYRSFLARMKKNP